MKKQIYKSITLPEENIIRVTMYLHPVVYADSEAIVGSVKWDSRRKKYYTNINPNTEINGPLSKYGEELEPPIADEYKRFIEDCDWLIDNSGFTIIKRYTSTNSRKSEYFVMFGLDDEPCGSIIFDLRISDHPFDATFPDDLKKEVIQYLQMNKILDESATEAGINFQIEKITVGSVKHDSWARAFNRLGNLLDKMRNKVRKQLAREHRND